MVCPRGSGSRSGDEMALPISGGACSARLGPLREAEKSHKVFAGILPLKLTFPLRGALRVYT